MNTQVKRFKYYNNDTMQQREYFLAGLIVAAVLFAATIGGVCCLA